MPDKDKISELLDDYAEAYAAYQTTEGKPKYLKAMQNSKAKITQLLLEERLDELHKLTGGEYGGDNLTARFPGLKEKMVNGYLPRRISELEAALKEGEQ